MRQLPFMKALYDKKLKTERFPGLLQNLSVKTSPSTARNFPNMVFIDTPGLADGGLQYKFDVEEVLLWFTRHCDLVLVFLDPIGQALCQKTNKLVKRLMEEQDHAEVRFYMTKGDMFKSEEDRSKCMCQITQTLSSTIKPAHGFQMPLIYVPEEANYYLSANRKLPDN